MNHDQCAPHSVTGSPGLDYAPGQPNLYKMMCLKQDLVSTYGLTEGFAHYQEQLICIGHGELLKMPLVSEREFAIEHGILFVETAPSGEAYVHFPPDIVGESNHRTVSGLTRAQYVACLNDARVRGRSAVILCKGQILLDVQGDEASRLDDELEWDPVIFHSEAGHAWYIPPRDDISPIVVDEAFSLLGAHTDFFGHWMTEYLPKFVAAQQSGKLPGSLTVLIDAHMPPSHRQSLDLLFGTEITLLEVPAFVEVFVRRLWCGPTLMYMPLHEKRNERFSWETVSASPARFSLVLQEMAKRANMALKSSGTPMRRIFLARKAFRHRKLLNHQRIESEAYARGFQIVYPEDHSFAEQVQLVRNAEEIIAPEGSQIFLTFFSPPDCNLTILSHPLTDVLAEYNGILTTRGVHVQVLTGPSKVANNTTPHDSDYEISPDEFCRLFERLNS